MAPNAQAITIVPLEAGHIQRLAEIERECFSTPWSEEALSDELSNPLALFFVALVGEEIAGYVGMTAVIDEGYLANLAVTARFRRRGVARALLHALIGQAIEKRLRFITLEVRASNSPAQRLYRLFGFETVGRRRGFYASPIEDALLMTKNL